MINIPNLAPPVHRTGGALSSIRGVTPSGCSFGNQITCAAEAAGVAATCATIETGVGAVACLATATGFVADCKDCEAAQPIKGTVCLAAKIAGGLGLPVPADISRWCA